MGGFAALEWAVTYPHMVRKVIAVASSDKAPPVFSLAHCQAGIDTITADPAYREGDYYGSEGPVDGLTRAAHLGSTLVRSDAWIAGTWERKTAVASPHPWADRDGRYAFQAQIEQIARERAQMFDANHFIYTARACILHDIGYGNRGTEVAAQKIRAELLLLPISSDLLFPPAASQGLVDLVNQHGGKAELIAVDSPNGHIAFLSECSRFVEPISRFLSRDEMH
jgi:homoserine O-acetyltransferase